MEIGTFGPLSASYHESVTFRGAPQAERLTVVLLHGFGVPGTDLIWLTHDFFRVPAVRELPIRFVLPMAPLFLDERRDVMKSPRAWFPLDLIRLQAAVRDEAWDALAAYIPDGLRDARRALDDGLQALFATDVNPQQLVLGGFSQGAMVSADWTFATERVPAGLIQLSGIVLCESEWTQGLSQRRGLPVFLSHSPADVMLPFALAERFARLLQSAGLRCSFVESPGGHSVPFSILEHLADFLVGLSRKPAR